MPTLRYQNDGFTINDETPSTIAMNNEPTKVSIPLSPHVKATSSFLAGEPQFTKLIILSRTGNHKQ
ncbi:hypothetical protein ACHAXA_003687 [Cyclostephanos tholiformis]|uniref:Uncharacterized protein n=1 Tax=Cyclostephanos tholiformis TaxID=382380 RepID=A0ABD3SQ67_9STRA